MHLHGDLDRPGLGVHHGADAVDLARKFLIRPGVETQHGCLPGGQLVNLTLRHMKDGQQRVKLGNVKRRAVCRDQVADLDVAGRDEAVDR